jgi:hypothetical protein
MQKSLLFALSITAGLSASPALAAQKTYTVGAFHGVDTSAAIEVDAVAGPASSVVAEGSEQALARLVVEVRDGVLRLGRKPGFWGPQGPIRVRVSAPLLDSFEASSSGEIRASGATGAVRAQASSGGEVRVSGACSVLNADASSGGEVDASALRCAVVEAQASSGGDVRAFASDAATAEASSGGDVVILGNPKRVQQSSSSGGDVRIEG